MKPERSEGNEGSPRSSQTYRSKYGGSSPNLRDTRIGLKLDNSLFLSSYLAFLLREELLKPALATLFANQLTSLYDSLASLERVRNTPIPYVAFHYFLDHVLTSSPVLPIKCTFE